MVQFIDVNLQELDGGRIIKYRLFTGDLPMSYLQFIGQLSSKEPFRREFNTLLASSGFSAFRFEAPVLCSATIHEPFEFVLIDAPGLCGRTTDVHTFAQYFTSDQLVVQFKSLGADATLVVPSPLTSSGSDHNCYKHLASFVRGAPTRQIDALWEMVGTALQNHNGTLWFNTEGSGVAWLHIRLDTRPKYYGYTPYKTSEN